MGAILRRSCLVESSWICESSPQARKSIESYAQELEDQADSL
jgi:hypothetical protein